MVDEANPSGATNIQGASERLTSLFNSEPEPPTEENTEILADDSTTPETPPGDTTEEMLYEVKYGDSVEKLTLDQLIKGNMMHKNYTQGTMDNADMRRGLEEKNTKVDQYLVDLEALVNVEADNLATAEMQEMKELDPEAYWASFEKTKVKVDKLKQFQAQQKADKSSKAQTNLAKENELMLKAIPEWLDNDTAKLEWQELSIYLQGNKVDINTLTSHQEIVRARKAMLFDKIQTKSIDEKKVTTPPKSMKPGNTQDAKPQPNKARDRLRKTGNVKDAQAAFKALLFK